MTFEIPRDWTFKNAKVAEGFERHVREQLPFYDLVAGAVAHIARHYLPENGRLYDIGASTGNITRLLTDSLKARNCEAVSIDNSPDMATLFDGYGRFELSDVTEYDYEPFDVATLFLVVMFLPIGKRKAFLRLLYERLNAGGALIVVDKTEDANRYIGTIYRRLTLAGKVASGVDANEILQKELSLSGIQRPISRDIFPFVYYEFFRFGEFSGFIIEK